MASNYGHPRTETSRFSVTIMEYERGWGNKVDGIACFDTLEEAETFVKDFNKDNTASEVPDWYMVANPPEIIRL